MLRAVFLVPFLVAAACSGGGTPVYTLNASAAHDCATGRIVFAAEADGQFDLFVVNADGTGLAALTDTPVDEFSPSWSADGARIVFTRAVEGVHKIFSMAEDGTDVRQEAAVGSRVGSGAVACAPVGDGIAFLRPDASGVIQVWTGTLGGGATQLTTDGDDKTAVDWSPDGTEIVYASNSGAGGPDPGATTLFLTVLGGATTQLAQIEGSIDDLSWSSTDLIAASRQFILETVGFVLEVQIYETSGTLLGSAPFDSGLNPVTGEVVEYVDATWSPDGGCLAAGGAPFSPSFDDDLDALQGLYVLDLVTSSQDRVAPGDPRARLAIGRGLGSGTPTVVQPDWFAAVEDDPPPPVAAFEVTTAVPRRGEPVAFDPSASERAVVYEWDFDGNGSFDFTDTAGVAPTFTYPATGTFRVRLRVTDANGNTDETTRDVVVTAPPAGDATITIQFGGAAPGTVVMFDGEIVCRSPDPCSFTFPVGTEITIEAQPVDGSFFSHWDGCGGTTAGLNPCSLTLTEDITVTAFFE